MESKNHIENFERFLREKTDEFRMYPSKRVWYSVYNNMHPGNRLPSISMCIVLIFALLLVGYLNTDTRQLAVDNSNIAQKESKTLFNFTSPFRLDISNSTKQQSNLLALTTTRSLSIKESTTPYFLVTAIPAKQKSLVNISSLTANHTGNIASRNNKVQNGNSPDNNLAGIPNQIDEKSMYPETISNSPESINANKNETIKTVVEHIPQATEMYTGEKIAVVNKNKMPQATQQTLSKLNNNEISNIKISSDYSPLVNSDSNTQSPDNENKLASTVNNSLTDSEKSWIENYAMYNRPAPRKWAGKVNWQVYVTPSVVYRTLRNNATGRNTGSGTDGIANRQNVEQTVSQKPSFGVETGVALKYDVSQKIKFKAGLQFNYTRYNALAFDNAHPVATSLTMNNDDNQSVYEVFRTTPFSNTYGVTAIKLHNETYQLSIPLGADFRLAVAENVEWYVGGTIQPTFMMHEKAYLISTDRRAYVSDASMLNRFNLNTGLETYLAFKTNNYTWQVGPQFRAQIFSTNSKIFSIEERLQSYGFKIAISKKL